MTDLLNLPIDKMAGISFDCECGRRHFVGIKKIYIGQNPADELAILIKDKRPENILFISDLNTWAAGGNNFFKSLSDNKFKTNLFIFEGPGPLVPDERAVGRLLLETDRDTAMIITAGSGTLNDLSRYISFKLNIPYIIFCTAPSMDGYASTVSPIIVEGYKKTFEAVYPLAVIADERVISDAPIEMIRAGFGDIIGKFTALSDWELSNKINGEYLCPACEALMKKAVTQTVSKAGMIGARDSDAVKNLLDSLLLSGISMGLIGNSRPASGSEHHLAHYWEMKALKEGSTHPLHGNAVGAAAIVISTIYERLKNELGIAPFTPGPAHLSDILKRAGSADNPSDLGISRTVFHDSILHAKDLRPRYTILTYLFECGILEEMSDILTREFYS